MDGEGWGLGGVGNLLVCVELLVAGQWSRVFRSFHPRWTMGEIGNCGFDKVEIRGP